MNLDEWIQASEFERRKWMTYIMKKYPNRLSAASNLNIKKDTLTSRMSSLGITWTGGDGMIGINGWRKASKKQKINWIRSKSKNRSSVLEAAMKAGVGEGAFQCRILSVGLTWGQVSTTERVDHVDHVEPEYHDFKVPGGHAERIKFYDSCNMRHDTIAAKFGYSVPEIEMILG